MRKYLNPYYISIGSSDIRSLRTIHSKSMRRMRDILQERIRIIYTDGTQKIVDCTISDTTLEMAKSNEYIGKDSKVFNVLIEDFQKVEAPLVDFMYVEHNRIKYQVQTSIGNGIFSNSISLLCVIYKGDING